VLPYHHPLALAKAISTLDVLSGGRLDVSVGVGHAVQEFSALGVPFEQRGALTDEALAVMQELWTAERPSFRGQFFCIDGLAFEPKPFQSPRPPIYVGGNSRPALRRAARYEGWQPNPINFALNEVPPLLDYIRQQPAYQGKEQTFELCWLGFPDPEARALDFVRTTKGGLAAHRERLLAGFAELAGYGVTRAPVPLAQTGSLSEYLDYLQWFAAEVAPDLTRITAN
jgi:alkanesulfonate monooxygenase SsuD/methylene tetrahydromethanopterin reductase-like flavin-dependent oxidoreductase (luciferase family)